MESPILDLVEAIARRETDGHFTIFKFTTGWVAIYGTPNPSSDNDYKLLRSCTPVPNLTDALEWLIITRTRFTNDD